MDKNLLNGTENSIQSYIMIYMGVDLKKSGKKNLKKMYFFLLELLKIFTIEKEGKFDLIFLNNSILFS